jgi:hypothetical protein
MNESNENTGWTTAADAPAGWDKATTEKLARFEQGSRARSAAERAQRESSAEQVEVYQERDVTDPSRVYTPQEARERPQERQAEAERPELGGGGGEASQARTASWEDRQGELNAAETDAASIQLAGLAEQAQVAEVEAETPASFEAAEPVRQDEGLSPETAAALESIRAQRAQEREANERGNGLER